MRKHFLDNLRWGTVLSVLVYHVFYLYNAEGVLGGVGAFSEVQYQDAYLYFVYPWFMVLLFLIAGISSRYALLRQTPREFVRARTRKLLVPSTLGLFVYHWIGGWLYIHRIGGDTSGDIPAALRYPIEAVSGSGPLWFIQLLWVFSLLLLLVRKLDKDDRFYDFCGKASLPVLLALLVPVWGAAQILNAPVITTYRCGIYFTAFLLGYFVFAHDAVQERLAKVWLPLLLAAVLAGIGYTAYYFGQNYADDACLKHVFTNAYLWLMVLALLATGRAWWDKTSAFADYMTRSEFGIYVVHYIIALYACWALKTFTALPPACDYLLSCAAVLLISPAAYELLRRIPVIRWLLFGIKQR